MHLRSLTNARGQPSGKSSEKQAEADRPPGRQTYFGDFLTSQPEQVWTFSLVTNLWEVSSEAKMSLRSSGYSSPHLAPRTASRQTETRASSPNRMCITLHYITLHCTALHYATLHYNTLHYTTLHYTALHYTTLHYTALHYTTLHCTTLHCTTLHCTAPQPAWRAPGRPDRHLGRQGDAPPQTITLAITAQITIIVLLMTSLIWIWNMIRRSSN